MNWVFILSISLLTFNPAAFADGYLQLKDRTENGKPCKYLEAGAYQKLEQEWGKITNRKRCLRTNTGKEYYPERESRETAGGTNMRENLTDVKNQTNRNAGWAVRRNKRCDKEKKKYSKMKRKMEQNSQNPNLCSGEAQRISGYTNDMKQNISELDDAKDKRNAYIQENLRVRGVATSNIDQLNGMEPTVTGAGNNQRGFRNAVFKQYRDDRKMAVPDGQVGGQEPVELRQFNPFGDTSVKESYNASQDPNSAPAGRYPIPMPGYGN